MRMRPRRGRLFAALVLLFTGIFVACVAFLIFPSGSGVDQPRPYDVYIDVGPKTIDSINITIANSGSADTYRVDVDVEATPQPAYRPITAALLVYENATPLAQTGYNPPIATPLSIGEQIPFSLEPHGGQDDLGYTDYRGYAKLQARNFAYASDGTNALVELPAIGFDKITSDFGVTVMYSMQDASSYDWSVGQPPDVITSSSVLWSLPLTNGTYGSTILSSSAAGVNHSNQTRQTFFTFLAGVIFGVAGGALVGALTELLHAPVASKSDGTAAQES